MRNVLWNLQHCCGTHFPLRCVKGKHNPYFLYYGPNLWNGPNRISTNTRDWVCLTRGLMTRKVYHWHLVTLKTLLHSTCISHHEVWGCGVFSLVFFRRQSQVSGREKFCTNAQSVCCNWASLKSMGGCGILLLTDWLSDLPIHPNIYTEHHYVPGCVLQSLVLGMTRIISVILYWVLAMWPVLSWTWPGFPYSVLPPSHKVRRTTMIIILPRLISLDSKFPRKNLIGPAGVMCPPLLTAGQRGWSCVTASWMQTSRR